MKKTATITFGLLLATNQLFATENLYQTESTTDKLIQKGKEKLSDTILEKYKEWSESKSGFSLDVGVWYMMWDQTSDAKEHFCNNNLNVNYNIDRQIR